MTLNQAEIQVLATLYKAESEGNSVDTASLEESGKRYLNYLEDWSGAYSSLIDRGLITPDMEADTEYLPAIESGGMRRYLYHVRA